MRLIDADELLSKLNEAYKKANAEYHRRALNGFWCGTCSTLQEAIKEVEKQPTAFDVNKVVEQLGERIMLSRPMGMVPFKEAVEILKTGGKEQ